MVGPTGRIGLVIPSDNLIFNRKTMDIKEQYEELTKKLKEVVPFTALPVRNLVVLLRKKGHPITLKTVLIVKDVYNSGDISGILCVLEQRGADALVCGLTHLIISPDHPLFSEIVEYQRKRGKRIRKLNKIGG
jgi:hypothetical protein